MTPLLVLAGNQKEYLIWARENREAMEARGLAPRYLPHNSLNHLGYSKCFYLEIGSFYPRPNEMYRYFESHGILNLRQHESV